MINISANIAGHALMLQSPVALPTGSIAVDQLELAQVVGEEWAVCATVTAQFWIKPSEIYEAEFENNVAVIPQEVLSGVGLLHIAVYGSDAAGTKRISTNTVTMPITQGSFTEASAPAPSASMFEQAVSAAVEEVKDEILAPDAVDNDVLADMPAMTVKGNNTNQEADPKDISINDFLEMFAMTGASAQRNGKAGFVPRPAAGDGDRFLAGDGTYKTPPGGGGSSAETTNDITIRIPDRLPALGTVSDGDVLTLAMAQINNLVAAVEALDANKVDSNGDGSGVTVTRTGSERNFTTIPTTAISLVDLINKLARWYEEISGKLSTTGNAYRAVSIPMGTVDSTSTATAFTATVDGITELRDGVCVWLTNGVIASAEGCTLQINNLDAKPIYASNAATTAVTTTFDKAYTMLFVYNSTRVTGGCWDMVCGYDSNTTYTPAKLGFGYGTCSTAAATAAKTASISSYALNTGGIVAIKFDNDVPAGATLNITSKGAKAIYYKGAAITNGVIKAGDTVTFIYSTNYHVLSIDRAAVMPSPSDNIPSIITGSSGSSGWRSEYARADHTHELPASNLNALLKSIGVSGAYIILPYGASDGATCMVQLTDTANNVGLDVLSARDTECVFVIPLVPDPPDFSLQYFSIVAVGLISRFGFNENDTDYCDMEASAIADGKLYSSKFTLAWDGTQTYSTISVTDLTTPSAQGVSF